MTAPAQPTATHPRPAPAPLAHRVAAQARYETRAVLRNGEQLLLLLILQCCCPHRLTD